VPAGVTRHLTHDAEEFTERTQALRQCVFQLGDPQLVLFETQLHFLAALLLSGTFSLRVGELLRLLLLGLLEVVFATLDLRSLGAPAGLHLLQQLVDVLGAGRLALRQSGSGGEKDQCERDRDGPLHRASSAAGMGSRNRSGAACLRAIFRPWRTAGR